MSCRIYADARANIRELSMDKASPQKHQSYFRREESIVLEFFMKGSFERFGVHFE